MTKEEFTDKIKTNYRWLYDYYWVQTFIYNDGLLNLQSILYIITGDISMTILESLHFVGYEPDYPPDGDILEVLNAYTYQYLTNNEELIMLRIL
ncbi:hypothetical protein KAU11_09660 [Candidatus Babeliales bacterium]|nr:hypothetical protein [Candidatus Babeliales bacterium]